MANRTEPELYLPISLAQAACVVRQVVGVKVPGVSLIRVLLALDGQDRVAMGDLLADPKFDEPKISQTLIVGLVVLTTFCVDVDRKISEVAIEVGLSPSTTHRYLKTWVVVGVLEQDPTDRTYRLARRWRDEFAEAHPPTPLPSK
jgi:hypothetical protein